MKAARDALSRCMKNALGNGLSIAGQAACVGAVNAVTDWPGRGSLISFPSIEPASATRKLRNLNVFLQYCLVGHEIWVVPRGKACFFPHEDKATSANDEALLHNEAS